MKAYIFAALIFAASSLSQASIISCDAQNVPAITVAQAQSGHAPQNPPPVLLMVNSPKYVTVGNYYVRVSDISNGTPKVFVGLVDRTTYKAVSIVGAPQKQDPTNSAQNLVLTWTDPTPQGIAQPAAVFVHCWLPPNFR